MSSFKHHFPRIPHILLYGSMMAIMVLALKWLQWRYLIADNASEIYIGLIAALFTFLGVWIATQMTRLKVKTIVIEKEVYISPPEGFAVNEAVLKKLALTGREYDVLKLLAQGCSNAEIADKLFLSLSTVKTHVSNLFVKMDVRTRIQAVEKAKRLRLTP